MSKRNKNASAPQYDANNEPTIFTLKIFHGGKMVDDRYKHYVGGYVDYFDYVDADMFGLIELQDFANQLGYNERKLVFWHQFGANLHTGGRMLELDNDVCGMVNYLTKEREAWVYFQHLDTGREMTVVDGGDFGPEVDMSFLDNVILNEPEASYSENSEDSDALVDSEYDMDEDDRLYEKYIDHDAEFNPVGITDDKMENKYVSEKVYAMLEDENETFDNSSDEFESIQGSDEEDLPKFPKFNVVTESRKPELKVGLIFSSKKEAKEAITTFCIKRGMSFRFNHNDKKRLQGVCRKEGCDWYVWVSPMHNDRSWQIKAYNPEHTKCSWNYKNESIKSNWVGKHYVKKLKNNPKLKTNEFRVEVCTKLKVNISMQQAYRARKKALELIEGTIKEQFGKIRDYCEELLRTNPGSSVVLKLTNNDGEGSAPQFQRLYICFEACKQGFKACRKVIGVDGCFLKGHYGGQLLTAVGIDPNNNLFPIAYAVVESETRDTWEWFLTLLDNDIGFDNQYAWTFMSDKQKGLIPAFESLFPDADNRFCVQHLHSNMKKDGFSGLAIKKALWAAARATRVESFNARMEEMKELDEKTYDWLVKRNPSQWSRAYFNAFPKCDILTNNMCESFNSLILPARDKSIIVMLETIRNIIMVRLQVNRDVAEKWDDAICPRIKLTLQNNMRQAAECIPMKSDDWHFQIMGPFDQHTVDISQKSCSCRRWDLTGIPCKHVISAIWCRDEQPESYVHPFYSVEAFKEAYAHLIFGIMSSDFWPKCGLIPPLPPKYEKRAGRPKKLRRRGHNEPPPPTQPAIPHRVKKNQRPSKCRKCGVLGHNVRTCPEKKKETNAGARTKHVEPAVVESEEILIGESQPISVENTPAGNEVSLSNTQAKIQKLPVRRNSDAYFRSCVDSSTNPDSQELSVVQSSRVHCPFIVKGGVNYITMSNLTTYMEKNGSGSSKVSSKENYKGKASDGDKGGKPN